MGYDGRYIILKVNIFCDGDNLNMILYHKFIITIYIIILLLEIELVI